MNNCVENFLEDVVAIQIFDSNNISFGLPLTLPNLREIKVLSYGEPDIDMGLSDSFSIQFDELPSLSISNERTSAGVIYTHELEIPIVSGVDDISDEIHNLIGKDIHVVYILSDGSKRVSLSLPNTSDMSCEDKLGSDRTLTVKVSLKSTSEWVVMNNF